MIINKEVITDIKIESVNDLYKLKPLIEGTSMRINKSQIARELGIDRRTVGKYINGFQKSKTRKANNCLKTHYKTVSDLLDENSQQIFYYKRFLHSYLVDNCGYKGSYRNFCTILRKYPELEQYFHKRKPSNVNNVTVRYETSEGKQAQIDWKESIDFLLVTGEKIVVNVFVLLLSYSRYRVYNLSLTKTQDILLNFLDSSFETIGGVPSEILCDNMKTIMDAPRTERSKGVVNKKFAQFAKDYGFTVKPCMAGRPQTKAKVESPMKLLDEIRAYNGKLSYDELTQLVKRLNDRKNASVVQGTGRIPLMYLDKERVFLQSLPPDNIRKPYKITSKIVKVNNASMINSCNCQYSVPPVYVGKYLTVQIYDGYLHIYDSTNLVALHSISSRKLNYTQNHYEQIARVSLSKNQNNISKMAKENLLIMGGLCNER